jgi:heat shock protein HtpX
MAAPNTEKQKWHRAHKVRNVIHSVILVLALAGLMSLCALIIWGWSGVVWAIAGAFISFALGPRISPKVVMRMFRARPVTPDEAGTLYKILSELSARAELPAVPKLNLIPSPTLNAFAVGKRTDAAIAISSGLLDKLTTREIAGVLAHEVSHIASNDLWIMGLADTFGRLTQIMSWFGVFLLLFNLPMLLTGGTGISWFVVLLLYFAPTIGNLLQLALSRSREYDADLEGTVFSGDPAGLAMALEKLEHYQGSMWEDMLPTGRRVPIPSVLRTHPPTEERVRRLLEIAPPDRPYRPLPRITGARPTLIRPLNPYPRYYWPGVWF